MFADIKIYQRVHVRRDRKMVNYMGFVYLACIKIYEKKATKEGKRQKKINEPYMEKYE